MSLAGASERETLERLEPDGSLSLLDGDLSLSNGLAWTRDGRRLYHADSERRTVWSRAYDPTTGAVGERRVFVQLDEGYPDGMASDAEDHLWIAIWGGGEIRRYAPDARLVDRIAVPAPHTSSVAFVGAHLDRVVITSATQHLSADALRTAPLSGRLFSAPVEVPGAPVASWSGLGGARGDGV